MVLLFIKNRVNGGKMVIIRRNMIRFCANKVLFSRKLNTILIFKPTFGKIANGKRNRKLLKK